LLIKAFIFYYTYNVSAPLTITAQDYAIAAVLGLFEGLTEFLPISSTAHLHLVSAFLEEWLPSDRLGHSQQAFDLYAVFFQGFAILAVAVVFWPQIVEILFGVLGKSRVGFHRLGCLAVAFTPVAIVGALFGKKIQGAAGASVAIPIGLLAGNVFLFWMEKRYPLLQRRASVGLTFGKAFGIGLLQLLAFWPGVSRSLMGIVGGVAVGLSRREAVAFAFLLGLATLSAASFYTAWRDWHLMTGALPLGPLLLGCGVAFGVALGVARIFIQWIGGHSLMVFFYYRLLLALGIILWG
jgi:undecaprenyl-diphosphatase